MEFLIENRAQNIKNEIADTSTLCVCSTEVTLHKIAGSAVSDAMKGRMVCSDSRAQVADRAGEEQADYMKIGECKFHRPCTLAGTMCA